jgi:hypothetical protein
MHRRRIAGLALGLIAAAGLGVASFSFPSSSVASGSRVVAGHGIRMELPPGWDGRVYQRSLPGSLPVLQAASFTLPRAGDDDVGSNAVRRMRAGSVRFGLLEVGEPAGPRFHPARLPLRIARGDFGAPFEGVPLEHAFATKHVRVAGRAFVLWADFTTQPVSPTLLEQANRVLATVKIAARRLPPRRPSAHDAVERSGIRALVPAGWRVVDERLTPCVDPIERLTATGPDGAMVMLQESLSGRKYLDRFPAQPAAWDLPGRPQQIACCAPTNAAGWMLRFRASGRSFYVYVYAHNPAARRDALTVLDSISVRPAHA